jgi:AraC family transcriptional regulator
MADERTVQLIAHENQRLSAFLHGLSNRVSVKEGSTPNICTIGSYSGQEGDVAGLCLPQHVLAITDKSPARWHDGRKLYSKRPGALSFVPAGLDPRMRAETPFQVSICLLDPALLSAVERELDHHPNEQLHPIVNFHDIALQQLMALLHTDASQGKAEELYTEHLTHALVLRLLSLKGSMTTKTKVLSPLPCHNLRRVVERMKELGTNLTLEELAKESGYCRHHFLRMFQAATGRTPHNYVTHLRLERAQELIKKRTGSLVDVASACGFSSHSHMTRVFRKILGVTPSEYQRHLSGRRGISRAADATACME